MGCKETSNDCAIKLCTRGTNIGIVMLYDLNLGFLNITDSYHGNQVKGITMVTAVKIKILQIP